MTWVVKAIKAAMFGAYGSGWQQPLEWIAATIVVAIASAILWGRWRFVDPEHIRPAVDF
jgi:putative membrane protein